MNQEDSYFIKRWSKEYFDINAHGHVIVKPNGGKESGDLYTLIQSAVEQGIDPPLLIRFNGILKKSLSNIHQTFISAIEDLNYRNKHQMAFPIKVNPQRAVVESVREYGKEFNIGLEVGSKPELIAVITLEGNKDELLLCNGYKDAEYISLALMACKLGKRAIIIIEQIYELNLVLQIAKNLGIEAEIGLRMKLSYQGTGRWQASGGDHAKFGLFTFEIMDCLEKLKAEDKSHWLKLLHFHIGSQQTTIETIKNALNEASRMYVEIAKDYPSLNIFDVGGGLAVDYDGTKSKNDSSMNYTIEEYARNVVAVIGEACLKEKIPDPIIITESGRAVVTHHSVLVVEVIDVTSLTNIQVESSLVLSHPLFGFLSSMERDLSLDNCREIFHDLMELKDTLLAEFIHGKISIEERALAEKFYRSMLVRLHKLYKELPETPEEIDLLDKLLLETYFCNFSIFQSLPDSWAIDQLFPVMPIHRLNTKPEHQGVIVDLTCDSDGKINKFVGRRKAQNYLNLHSYNGEPYYIGIFLVGAYQEIIGGLHNLFGDTNVIHADLNEKGEWEFSKVVEGDTVEEVLHYAQYNTEKQLEQLHLIIEQSIQAGRITLAEAAQIKKRFKGALESYTYLII